MHLRRSLGSINTTTTIHKAQTKTSDEKKDKTVSQAKRRKHKTQKKKLEKVSSTGEDRRHTTA